jgi:GntR family transcriptional repressor for pyruvate dehydrogenase complex
LLGEIRRRGLAPGTRMPSERELQQALGVGRSTVREALNGLAMLGIIDIRHGQGAFVAKSPSASAGGEEVSAALAKGVTRDLLEARRPVEIEIARLAARRRTPADLEEIEDVLREHDRALADGEPAAAQSAGFHLAIARAAHNEVLAGFVASYTRLLAERGPELEKLDGYRVWEVDEHRRLYEAIRDGEPDLAAEYMRAHLAEMSEHHDRLTPSSENVSPALRSRA